MTTNNSVLEANEIQETTEKPLTFNRFRLPTFLKAGLQELGFVSPTKVQAEAIPVLLAGHDLVAQSHTGSGKTAAFAIPVLANINRQSRDLQALVMVPTRELALQVTNVFKSLAGSSVRITTIYGGASLEGQSRGLIRGGYQVVIGTPGRLRDHLNRGTLRLERLRFAVLDEADEMLDRGFAQDVEAILQEAAPKTQRQTALFSATLPEWVMDTATRHLRPDYTAITLPVTPESQPNIEQIVYDMKLGDKHDALRQMLNTFHDSPILVFARTKHGVKKLADRLQHEGYSAAGLQGNLSQRAREEVVSAFRHNRIRIMVATNVGARGLDISGISHVINFDLPESAELFTHRVGRTGRNGASGTAITFLTGEDKIKWREIERFITHKGITYERKRFQFVPEMLTPRIEPVVVPPLKGDGFAVPENERSEFGYEQERGALGRERGERGERRDFGRDRGERGERGFGRSKPSFGGGRPRRERSSEPDVVVSREGDTSSGRRSRRFDEKFNSEKPQTTRRFEDESYGAEKPRSSRRFEDKGRFETSFEDSRGFGRSKKPFEASRDDRREFGGRSEDSRGRREFGGRSEDSRGRREFGGRSEDSRGRREFGERSEEKRAPRREFSDRFERDSKPSRKRFAR